MRVLFVEEWETRAYRTPQLARTTCTLSAGEGNMSIRVHTHQLASALDRHQRALHRRRHRPGGLHEASKREVRHYGVHAWGDASGCGHMCCGTAAQLPSGALADLAAWMRENRGGGEGGGETECR